MNYLLDQIDQNMPEGMEFTEGKGGLQPIDQGAMPPPDQPPTNQQPPGSQPSGPYDQWGGMPDVQRPNMPGAMPPPPGFESGWNSGQVGMGDYGSVQQYADQAHEEARRWLDPQQAEQTRRFDQELINKGLDPNSAAGQEEAKRLAMQHGQQDASAQFGALQFGQGIQNQMAQQQLQGRGQDLQKYGQDQNYNLGMAGIGTQMYGMDQQYNLGMGNLDMLRNNQDFMQMMGLEGVDFRNRSYNDQMQMVQDALYMNMVYGNPVPSGSQVNPYAPYNQQKASG